MLVLIRKNLEWWILLNWVRWNLNSNGQILRFHWKELRTPTIFENPVKLWDILKIQLIWCIFKTGLNVYNFWILIKWLIGKCLRFLLKYLAWVWDSLINISHKRWPMKDVSKSDTKKTNFGWIHLIILGTHRNTIVWKILYLVNCWSRTELQLL